MTTDQANDSPANTTGPRAALISRLTTPRRLMLAVIVVFCITLGAQIRAVWLHEGAFYAGGEVPLGGDLLAFYSAGLIVAEGDGEHLYDLDRQIAAQKQAIGDSGFDGLLPFAYPAFVAAPYALLARLPLIPAYLVVTPLMLAAVVAAVALLRPVSPTVRARPVLVTLAALASQPLAAATLGGQTVGFSLLCCAGTYAALRRDRAVTAGVRLGLLLYKPPLAVPLLALLLCRRQWRTVAVAGAVGLALFLVGVAVAGVAWPWRFLDLAGGTFAEGDAAANGMNMISLLGVAEQVFGAGSSWAWGTAGVLGLGVLVVVIQAWRGARADGHTFPLLFGLVIAGVLLLSPHALFYEACLLILPIIALLDAWQAHGRQLAAWQRSILTGAFALGFGWQFGALLGVQPVAVLPVAVAVLSWRALRQPRNGASAHAERILPRNQDFLGGITYPPRRESAHDGHLGGD